jgi:hypothetical protein
VGGVRLTSYRHLSGVVKNEWSHTFAQLYSVIAWAGENFNLIDAKEIRLEDRGYGPHTSGFRQIQLL